MFGHSFNPNHIKVLYCNMKYITSMHCCPIISSDHICNPVYKKVPLYSGCFVASLITTNIILEVKSIRAATTTVSTSQLGPFSLVILLHYTGASRHDTSGARTGWFSHTLSSDITRSVFELINPLQITALLICGQSATRIFISSDVGSTLCYKYR